MRVRSLCGLILMTAALSPAHALDISLDLFGTPGGRITSENRDAGTETKLRRPDGYGGRLIVWPGNGPLFFSAEYGRLESEDVATDAMSAPIAFDNRLDQARIGIGFINRSAFYTRLETVRTASRQTLGDEQTRDISVGLGIHAGVAGALYPRLLASAELGYVDLDVLTDEDEQSFGRGLQATVRGEVPIVSFLQIFTEYRYQRLRRTRDAPKEIDDIDEIRVGLRLNF